jgi:hypothetical protein
VLSDVREGKWIEGLSGRGALFSQPVRYAFRSIEWQRSVDADAVMRSTVALTSGYIGAFYTDKVTRGDVAAPSGLVVRANHGGELVDLLRLRAIDTRIVSARSVVRANQLTPIRYVESIEPRQATLSSVWIDRAGAPALTQSVTAWRDGTALALRQLSPDHRIVSELRPTGVLITSFEASGHEALVCFTQIAASQPCLRLWVSQDDARITRTPDGALRVETVSSDRLDVLVTALTAGQASVDLHVLHPNRILAARNVGAALLYGLDPAYFERLRRLEALGFTEAFTSGPYRVLLRESTFTR